MRKLLNQSIKQMENRKSKWFFPGKLAMLVLMFVMAVSAVAQTKTVKGTVIDDLGEPIIGANVLISGTTQGTVTDLDGNYTLNNVPEDATLRASFIGYEVQELAVAGRAVVDFTLKSESTELDDVVVVGYGTMKKSDLTGSVSSVSTDKLNAKGATSVMENLQGSVPGVSITQSSSRAGGGFDIEIRGKSSLGSNNSPLYVVDGIICDDINFLNSQDIERIDILKDASSTAIYGSRATNGVVIVSTKSGSSAKGGNGDCKHRPVVSYDGYYGITTAARIPDFMNAEQFAQYRHMRYLNASQKYAAQNDWTISIGNYKTAWLTGGDVTTSYIKDLIANGNETDWIDDFTRVANQQNHYISVSGNTGTVNYLFGLGYQGEEGIYVGDKMQRVNLKGTVDTKFGDYVSSGVSFNVANTYNKTIDNTAVASAFRLNPCTPDRDADGNIVNYPGKAAALGNDTEQGGDDSQFTGTQNPLFDLEGSDYQTRSWQILANAYVEVRPFKGLSLKTTFSPSFTHSRAGQFEASSTSARNGGDNRASVSNTTKFNWTWDTQINYNVNVDEHSIALMGLISPSAFNQEKYEQEAYGVVDQAKWYNLSQASSTTYTSGSSYTEWSMLSYALRANYTFRDRYMFTGTVRWDASSRFDEKSRWGSFPSLALAWRMSEEDFIKQYDWIQNLKLRVSFGTTGNNYTQGTNYPTTVTASGGTTYYGFADGTGNTPYAPSGIVNKDLTWEKTTEYNAGLDFGFIDGRINGSLDLYSKTSKDLLMSRQLTYEAGGAKVTDNIGKVANKGVELTLTTTNVKTSDLTWTTTFSFAHNVNEIKEVNGGKEDDIANSWFVGESINAIYNYSWDGIVSDKNIVVPDNEAAVAAGFTPGSSVLSRDYYFAVYGWGEGMPIIRDLNGDGKIDSKDKHIIGKSDPAWTGSISSNLSYKNWDFSFSIYTKQNYEVYSSFHNQYVAYGDRGMQHLNMDFYIPDGALLNCDFDADGNRINEVRQQGTHYGKYPFPTNESATNAGAGTIWAGSNAKSGIDSMASMASANSKGTPSQIVKGDYWKVKNISLGYTFSKDVLAKTFLTNARLYLNVTNPFVFTDYEGFDPEWSSASLSKGGLSSVTWQIGASLKF